MTSVAVLWLALAFAAPVKQAEFCQQQSPDDTLSYEEFIQIPEKDRLGRFDGLTATSRACLKRAHTRRWLDKHRGELSQGQVRVVEQAIAFITPEIYSTPERPDIVEREAELKVALACKLGRDQAHEAFALMRPSKVEAPPKGRIARWFEWFSDCVIG